MSEAEEWGVVAVVMGGDSSEREISLRSGRAVYRALREEGIRAVAIELTGHDGRALLQRLKAENVECVFIALHGAFGENGELQAILDEHGIPYIGSGAQASRIAFNKAQTQNLMKENGVSVAEFAVVQRGQADLSEILQHIDYPVFVKPAEEGSSIGISFVEDKSVIMAALEAAWRYGAQVLIEKAIKGREFTVGILGEAPLAVVEVCPPEGFFNFAAKYEKGKTQYLVPAPLDEKTTQKLQREACRAFELLGCRHFARADFKLDDKGQVFFLEMNTIPGFTETSLLPKAAAASGLNFNQLCLKLIGMAYGKKKKISSITHSN